MQTPLTTYDSLNKYSPTEQDVKPYYLPEHQAYPYYPQPPMPYTQY